MGRAIVRDPEVFLFDEPLSNLDAKLRVQMRAEIKELHQRLRTTTIYVTHDQIEAMTMADRIVVMHDGVIEQVGTPLDLYDKPANTFVAGFIGSPAMNMIKGVLHTGSTPHLKFGDSELPIPQAPKDQDGREMIAGIRPEHFVLDNTGVRARVVVVEPTGPELLVNAKIASTHITAVFRERHAFRPGDEINLKPVTGSVHLFDASNGHRI